jgi:XTP/dITP diphosphohydrolase
MELVFATNNKHKLEEVRQIVGQKYELLSLLDIRCFEELPETQDTIEGNARQKAKYICDQYSVNCFADDTGLEIEALNGEPGVYSARYAGDECNFENNIDKVLQNLKGVFNRKALFKTVISLFLNGKVYSFTGIVHGTILQERRGTSGFGYDSVFLPDGYTKTYAEMSAEEKNRISHRGIATRGLCDFLNAL